MYLLTVKESLLRKNLTNWNFHNLQQTLQLTKKENFFQNILYAWIEPYMNTPPAVRCTVRPPRWAEKCPSVSPPPFALCTAARDHGESRLGSSLSENCRCYSSVGCIFSAPHPFLPSPPSHPAPGWLGPLRKRILYQAPAAGPVFWHWWEWRGHKSIFISNIFEKLHLL